ncbi:MAG TPA: FAD-dependent oxidoreductase [Bacteroidota bacterium]|nr:FAD-dependent oxidoreductase [Bacteroidota bacterium]
MKRRILVIGGLAAGPSAAAKAKRVSPGAEVVLYEQGEHISYGICEIPYFIAGEIADPQKLVVYDPERMEKEKGVVAKVLHTVEEILPSRKEITVRDLRSGKTNTEAYDKLIIATGSTPKRLQLEGERSRNVFVIKDLDEAYGLNTMLGQEKPRRAVIVGGGFVALEMADAFVRRGMDVTMIHHASLPMSKFEDEGRNYIMGEIESHGVTFMGDTKVEWLGVGARGSVVAVGTRNVTIETDIVVIAIGVKPESRLALAAGIQLGPFGGIRVDEKMRALGAESVFAAGDCCELKNVVTKKPMYIALATTASKTGRVAGENAAGGNAAFKGTLRAIGVRAFDKEVAHVGLSSTEAKDASFDPVVNTIHARSKIGIMPDAKEIHFTLVADKQSRRLLGANVIGEEGAILRANTLAAAIRHGMTIDDVEHFDLIYTPPYAPLWDGIIISAEQMKKKLDGDQPAEKRTRR